MSGAETRPSRSLITPQQGMPSENGDKYDRLFHELAETHNDRNRRRFYLLLECINDGVDRIVEQTGGFCTK